MAEQPLRTRIAAVAEVFDDEYLTELATNLKSMTKGYRADHKCGKCGHRANVLVQIPDVDKQIKSLMELLEQTEGKPGTVDGEPGGTTIIVERIWPGGENGDSKSPGEIPAAHTADDLPLLEGEG